MPDYGYQHQKARAAVAAVVQREGFICARCGKQRPAGTPFEYDHDDNDPNTYLGPSCVPCNRGAGGRKGRRNDRLKRIRTRNW